MTDDEIDLLTIKQVRVIAERASDALKTLRDLGLTGPAGAVGLSGGSVPRVLNPAPIIASDRCPVCARAIGTATSFAECALGVECPAVANRKTNKPALVHTLSGPNGATAVTGDRAALLAQPAFDAEGNPL